jgi:RHS repeat-associated protein
MVAIDEILLPESTGEGCGGDNDIFTDRRVHRGSAENRAPVTRNRRSAPILDRWLTRDPISYRGGINFYGYVDSSPVGNVDAWGYSWVSTGSPGPSVTASSGP